jgi:hypothetical protein
MAGILFIGRDEPHFQVITFESTPVEDWSNRVSFLNPIFCRRGDVASDGYCQGYDQFLIDVRDGS